MANATAQQKLWVVDDDRSIRFVLSKALEAEGYDVSEFEHAAAALDALAAGEEPSLIISDIRMPGLDGFKLLDRLQKQIPDVPVIIMTAHSDLDSAVNAYEGGAFEYLPKPFDLDDAIELVRRALRQISENSEPVEIETTGLQATGGHPAIIGEAPAMQEVFRAIGRLSRSNITVLINGESGTGKELVAKALHDHSPRAQKPFIALNTAAIPKDLLESELFGHERGAFTGANTQRKGRFEQADTGTLFLDEIGDMPAELQTRLLRVLADGEFYRVGGHTPIKVDVRIIAATHQNLETRVTDGLFREDLFHRLNVIRIQLPALRERSEDIPLLLNHFLIRVGEELSVEPKTLSPEVMRYLSALPWPGNVRQLENACRYMTVMAATSECVMEDLPPELKNQDEAAPSATTSQADAWQPALHAWASRRLAAGVQDLLADAMPVFEKTMIEVALDATNGHKQEAARLLGWGRNTLTRKIKSLEVDESAA